MRLCFLVTFLCMFTACGPDAVKSVVVVDDSANHESTLPDITVRLSSDGGIVVDGNDVVLADLPETLRRASANWQTEYGAEQEPGVTLLTAPNVDYSTVVSVMDEIQKSGLSNISLAAGE